MVDANKHAATLGVVFYFIEQDCRIRFVARIDLGDGAHFKIPVSPIDSSKLSQFVDFLDPPTQICVVHRSSFGSDSCFLHDAFLFSYSSLGICDPATEEN